MMYADSLRALYREEFRLLAPALRILRIQTVLEQRLEVWGASLEKQYTESFCGRYKGKELAMAARMAVMQRLHPVRSQIRRMLESHPLELFAQMMRGAPEELAAAARETRRPNASGGRTRAPSPISCWIWALPRPTGGSAT